MKVYNEEVLAYRLPKVVYFFDVKLEYTVILHLLCPFARKNKVQKMIILQFVKKVLTLFLRYDNIKSR